MDMIGIRCQTYGLRGVYGYGPGEHTKVDDVVVIIERDERDTSAAEQMEAWSTAITGWTRYTGNRKRGRLAIGTS